MSSTWSKRKTLAPLLRMRWAVCLAMPAFTRNVQGLSMLRALNTGAKLNDSIGKGFMVKKMVLKIETKPLKGETTVRKVETKLLKLKTTALKGKTTLRKSETTLNEPEKK